MMAAHLEDDQKGSIPVHLLVMCMALVALYGGWVLWRACLPLEIDRNEAWNAWHALDAFKPNALYPMRQDLVINNYPPLSFLITNMLTAIRGDAIQIGRTLSLVATLSLAISIGGIVRIMGCSSRAALMGAAWFLATMLTCFSDYVGMNDPNLLGLAMSAAGFHWFLCRYQQDKGLAYGALVLMVCALFVKHTLIVLPLAAIIWLFLERKDLAIQAVVLCGAMGIAGLGLCHHYYGDRFFSQLTLPRETSIWQALKFLRKLPPLLPALIIWIGWARHQRTASARLTWIMVPLALTLNWLQRYGRGVDDNAQFEFVFALSIGLALALDDLCRAAAGSQALRHGNVRRLYIGLIGTLLILSNHIEPYLWLFSSSYRQDVARQSEIAHQEIARIGKMSGPISCSIMTICFEAKKSFVYDSFGMSMRVATGQWSEIELARRQQQQGIRFEQIDPRAEWTDRTLSSAVMHGFAGP